MWPADRSLEDSTSGHRRATPGFTELRTERPHSRSDRAVMVGVGLGSSHSHTHTQHARRLPGTHRRLRLRATRRHKTGVIQRKAACMRLAKPSVSEEGVPLEIGAIPCLLLLLLLFSEVLLPGSLFCLTRTQNSSRKRRGFTGQQPITTQQCARGHTSARIRCGRSALQPPRSLNPEKEAQG